MALRREATFCTSFRPFGNVRKAGSIRVRAVAEPDDSGYERVKVAGVRAVINDRGAYRQLAAEQRSRWRSDPGFLNVDHDIAIDLVGIGGAIAKADNVELDRRQQFSRGSARIRASRYAASAQVRVITAPSLSTP